MILNNSEVSLVKERIEVICEEIDSYSLRSSDIYLDLIIKDKQIRTLKNIFFQVGPPMETPPLEEMILAVPPESSIFSLLFWF